MKKQFFYGLLILLPTSSSFGQKNTGSSGGVVVTQINEDSTDKNLPQDGTYQFRIERENYRPLLTADLVNLIHESRKVDEDVVIRIDDFILLFLPSENRINNPSFTPLEKYIYLD